jgi:MFS family permease
VTSCPSSRPWGLLSNPNFLVFLIVVFLVATQLQFFFLGTAPYLSALGVPGRSIPAVMTLAQVAQLAATAVLAFHTSDIRGRIGFVGIFSIGIALWLAMYAVYALMPRRLPVSLAQALHGLAYTFLIWVGFVYVNEVAPTDIRGSAQALYTVVFFGLGFFLGTQFTGIVMDKLKTPEGGFRWRPLFLVPCGMMLLCLIVMATMFRG